MQVKIIRWSWAWEVELESRWAFYFWLNRWVWVIDGYFHVLQELETLLKCFKNFAVINVAMFCILGGQFFFIFKLWTTAVSPTPRNCLKIQLYPAAVLTFFFFTHRLDKKDEAFNFNLQRCLGLEWILSLGKALSIPWKKKLLVCMKWIFRAVGGLQSLKDFFILFVEHPFLTVFLTRFLWRYYYFKQHHTIGNPGNPNLAL